MSDILNWFFGNLKKSSDKDHKNSVFIIDNLPGYNIAICFDETKIKSIDFLSKSSAKTHSIYMCEPKIMDARLSGLFFRYKDGKENGFINFKKLSKELAFDKNKISSVNNFVAQEYKSFPGTKSNVFTMDIQLKGFRLSIKPNFLKKEKDVQIIGEIDEKIRDEMLKLKPSFACIVEVENVNKYHKTEANILHELNYLYDLAEEIKTNKSKECLYFEDETTNFILNQAAHLDDKLSISCSPDMYDKISKSSKNLKLKHKLSKTVLSKDQYKSIYDFLYSVLYQQIETKSGIKLNYEKTNAMWTVDINSGSYGNKSENIYQNIFNVNMEACAHILIWINLIGADGLITIDLIDMYKPEHKKEIKDFFDKECKNTKIKVSVINCFSLITLSKARSNRCLYTKFLSGKKHDCYFYAIYVICYLNSINKSVKTLITVNENTLKILLTHIAPLDLKFYVKRNTDATIQQLELEHIQPSVIFNLDEGITIPQIKHIEKY